MTDTDRTAQMVERAGLEAPMANDTCVFDTWEDVVRQLRDAPTHAAHKGVMLHAAIMIEAVVAELASETAAREKAEREMIAWRSAFQSVTPGGSEFCDPKAVREWADALKMDVFNANKRAVLSERRAITPKENPDAPHGE